MGLARAFSVVVSGVDAHLVEVEAHLSPGLPSMYIVGLADTAVAESRDRVRAAVLNSGARWPQHRITVGLSPASLHKRGSALDLAIASAVLAADGQIPSEPLQDAVLFGELGLDGRVRPVRGAVVAAVAAARAGRARIVLAGRNAAEASVVPGIEPVGIGSLRQWAARLTGRADEACGQGPDTLLELPGAVDADHDESRGDLDGADLADVLGQSEAVAALEVAAVGGHHLAMVGRPGVGKTLIAERLPTILPDLGDADALTATAIRSLVTEVRGLVRRPPFQAPHHTATVAAIVGGGRGAQATPGAVTLAHAGVLFLDEAAEFSSACLEALRLPLESGSVCIARAGFTARMPARFQLVLAANPCPCGMGDGSGEACRCRSADRRRYLARLSGPVMDRVDIRLALDAPRARTWTPGATGVDSATVRGRVVEARQRSLRRAARLGLLSDLNGRQASALLRGSLAPGPAASDLLAAAISSGRLSARGADRVIRVAWSVADLAGADRPGPVHVGRALTLRSAEGVFGLG